MMYGKENGDYSNPTNAAVSILFGNIIIANASACTVKYKKIEDCK